MKILVTGAAGYIGSNLCDQLLNNGHTVVAIDNFNEFYDEKVKRFNISTFENDDNFTLYEVDITDRDKLLEMFDTENNIDAVVHLAAWAGVTPSVKKPSIYIWNNVDGTNNLAEFAVNHDVKTFIFASSSSIYGDNEVPFVETMNTDYPNAPYPASKKAGEVLLYTYHKNFDLNVSVFRFFNPIGPRLRPDLATPKLIRSAEYGYVFPVYQNPEASSRDYTYIGDMLSAVETACDTKLGYEIMNLGNSTPKTLIDLKETVEKVTNKKVKTKELPLPGQMTHTYANIDKAKKLLGYNPKTTLDQMIEVYYKWFLDQPEWYQKIRVEK